MYIRTYVCMYICTYIHTKESVALKLEIGKKMVLDYIANNADSDLGFISQPNG